MIMASNRSKRAERSSHGQGTFLDRLCCSLEQRGWHRTSDWGGAQAASQGSCARADQTCSGPTTDGDPGSRRQTHRISASPGAPTRGDQHCRVGYVESIITCPHVPHVSLFSHRGWAVAFASFDIIGDFCFSEPFGCLERGSATSWALAIPDLLVEAILAQSVCLVFGVHNWLQRFVARLFPDRGGMSKLRHFQMCREKTMTREWCDGSLTTSDTCSSRWC